MRASRVSGSAARLASSVSSRVSRSWGRLCAGVVASWRKAVRASSRRSPCAHPRASAAWRSTSLLSTLMRGWIWIFSAIGGPSSGGRLPAHPPVFVLLLIELHTQGSPRLFGVDEGLGLRQGGEQARRVESLAQAGLDSLGGLLQIGDTARAALGGCLAGLLWRRGGRSGGGVTRPDWRGSLPPKARLDMRHHRLPRQIGERLPLLLRLPGFEIGGILGRVDVAV